MEKLPCLKKVDLLRGPNTTEKNANLIFEQLFKIRDENARILGEQISRELQKKYIEYFKFLKQKNRIDIKFCTEWGNVELIAIGEKIQEKIVNASSKMHDVNTSTKNQTRVEPKILKMVLIDIPNMTAWNDGDANNRPMNLFEIDWQDLKTRLKSVGRKHPDTIFIAKIFVRLSELRRCAVPLFNAGKNGFKVFRGKLRNNHDIDAVLATEMIYEVAMLPDHSEVGLILLSGDGNFVGAVERSKELAKKKKIKLTVHLISWSDRVSKELTANTDEQLSMEEFLQTLI